MTYFADVAALARKDILLELRSRDTLPAMLLFVVSALVVFHFSLPSDASDTAATGLLWIALLFTALLGLGRAFVAEREQRVSTASFSLRATGVRSGSRKSSGVLVFLVVAEVVALPAFALFFAPVGCRARRRRSARRPRLCAVGTLLAAMAAASRARELLLPLLFLPLVDPGRRRRRRRGVSTILVATSPFSPLRRVFAILAWASFEYVVTE